MYTTSNMRLERSLLMAGIAIPILYYGVLLVGSLFYPGYSHVTQYASELGSSSAHYPYIFNTGIMLMGVAAIAASLGLYLAVRRLTGRTVLATLIALLMFLFGVSMVMGGMFPMPDERHGGFGLGLGSHLLPLLLAVTLWKRKELRGLNIFLLVNFALYVGMFAIMMGVGGMVTRANVGLFQRTYSVVSFPWMAIVSYYLLRAVDRQRSGDGTLSSTAVA